AKNGPIVKYNMTVNNTPYIGCTRLANACKLLLFEKPIAIIPKSGNPTPVIANPNAAINSLVPEYCPNSAGNIKFPAPKKSANNVNLKQYNSSEIILNPLKSSYLILFIYADFSEYFKYYKSFMYTRIDRVLLSIYIIN